MDTATISIHDTAHSHDHDHAHDHHELSFIRKYIFSTDHKVIARQFLFVALFFMMLGGFMAMLIRWQLAFPGEAIPLIGQFLPDTWVAGGAIQPNFYAQLLSMHGTIMIFLVIIPLSVGAFGNQCIPLMIGTDDMALPKLNMFSFWLVPPAGLLVFFGFFVEGGSAAAGWTSYPTLAPLADKGQTLWLIGMFLVGFSSIMGAVNYITTILNKRAKGMTMFRMPLTVWALFITAVLITLGTPVLAAAISMQFMDQFLHTSFFMPDNLVHAKGALYSGGGQPILWQHLFWFYSHPAVYIMILPTMGIVSDVMSTFARKPVFGYKAMIFALMGIAFLGFIVYSLRMRTR